MHNKSQARARSLQCLCSAHSSAAAGALPAWGAFLVTARPSSGLYLIEHGPTGLSCPYTAVVALKRCKGANRRAHSVHCDLGIDGAAAMDPTCPRVQNLLLLDSEGKRIAVKYYTPKW